ncbi:MAG: class I SAM-dependent methyltransferase [Candidatus Acidiferrales bacterium]
MASYQEYSYFVEARQVQRLVDSETRWLDAGCGHQILELRLALEEKELVQRARLAVGCDAFVSSLSHHRSLQRRVACDLGTLPFVDGSFNLVTLNMVAEHLENPDAVVNELARVLEPGGVLLIHTPNAACYETKLVKLGWTIVPRSWAYSLIRFLEYREPEDVFPTFYKANTRGRILGLVSKVGMEEKEFTFVEGRPFFFFFAPASILELLFCRVLRKLMGKEFTAGTIIGVYRKKAG